MEKVETTPICSDSTQIVSGIQKLPEFFQFVAWYATPLQFRKPRNQKEFAKQIGVNEDSLTDWKRHPQFQPLLWQIVNNWIKDRIPDVIGGLYKRACNKGSAKDVEAFLRLAGMEIGKTSKKQ